MGQHVHLQHCLDRVYWSLKPLRISPEGDRVNNDDVIDHLLLSISSVSPNIRSLWDPERKDLYVLQYNFNPKPSKIKGLKLVQLGMDGLHDISQLDVYAKNPISNSTENPIYTFSPNVGTDSVQVFNFISSDMFSELYLKIVVILNLLLKDCSFIRTI